MKRTYELMVIAKSDFPVEDTKKLEGILASLVKGGTVKDVNVLGKKALAYPIKKQTEGVYIVATIEGAAVKVSDIQKESRLGTDIIRFQLIQKEG